MGTAVWSNPVEYDTRCTDCNTFVYLVFQLYQSSTIRAIDKLRHAWYNLRTPSVLVEVLSFQPLQIH